MSRVQYLLSSVALGSCLIGTAALAQQQPGSDTGISEIVVTATRQADTVSKVPFTVQAVTQATMDQQGIKNASDLVRIVPGLNVSNTGGTSLATFSIRGVVGGTGAATTGVYLDDTNLTKRANGGVAQENGAPVPLLYDLERVEVLKGPQGTLYGGSSEGGTIRYITPTPSLTQYSAQARAESSWYTGHGEQSWEVGGAAGGPIIQDKLGFRGSLISRNQGGYIDVLSPYTGQTIRSNANSVWDWAGRLALRGQLTDRFSVTGSYYYTSTKVEGGPSGPTAIYLPTGQLAPAGQTFTTPDMCVASIVRNPATFPNAVPGGAPSASFIPTNLPCTTALRATATYVRPGATYGPFATGPNIAYTAAGPYGGSGRPVVAGGDNNSGVAALTLNYDLDHVSFKSITSYLRDQAYTNSTGGEDYVSVANAAQTTTMTYPGCTSVPCRGFGLFNLFPDSSAQFQSVNRRDGIEQEFRLSSPATERPISWVAGLYVSDTTTHIRYFLTADPVRENALFKLLYGPGFTDLARYGLANTNGVESYLDASIHDTELAGFAEGNWYVTSKLKLTVGLRQSKIGLDYSQLNYGQTAGRYPDSQGALTQGKSNDTPLTPKFGVSYQVTDADMVYFTAAKGFRAGGVNTPLTQDRCGPYLALYGLTADTVPHAYAPDSVWSYELGAKMRAFDNRLQVNAAGFRIDWTGIQSTISLTCGQSFVTGGGRARSQGVDLQVQARPIRPLTFTLNFGYTDARYVDPIGGINGVLPAGSKASINSGDAISGAPAPIQVSLSGQYDFRVLDKYDSYLRFDYTYQNKYNSGPSFGSTGYNALTYVTQSRDQLNLRAGVRFRSFEINAFAINAADAHAPIGSGLANGRTCAPTSADCSAYSQFDPFVNQSYQAPRRVGLQVNYRY
ncbi:MAG TPA: TonB-dependent receptor [Caulobacteraceae bacterium]|jgi:outer membrane receptor protein involved in Fe transport